jgi:hypothetical protein
MCANTKLPKNWDSILRYWGVQSSLKSGGSRLVTELRPITWHVRLGPGPLGDNHTVHFFWYGDQSVGVYRYIHTHMYILGSITTWFRKLLVMWPALRRWSNNQSFLKEAPKQNKREEIFSIFFSFWFFNQSCHFRVGEKKHLIKKIPSGFLLDHPSYGLTRQIDWFTSGQLKTQILTVTNPPNAAGPGLLVGPKALGPTPGHGPSCWVLVAKGLKILGPSGGMTQLGVGSWW